MTANPWRGESEILLDGKQYILRPTFEALHRIEQELGTGVVAVAKKLAEGRATLEELAAIIIHCIEGDIPALAVKEALARGAVIHAMHAVATMLALVLGGHHDEPK